MAAPSLRDFSWSMDQAEFLGHRIDRPPGVSRSAWMRHWERARMGYADHGDRTQAYVDRVELFGVRVPRPSWCMPSQWVDFWEDLCA